MIRFSFLFGFMVSRFTMLFHVKIIMSFPEKYNIQEKLQKQPPGNTIQEIQSNLLTVLIISRKFCDS